MNTLTYAPKKANTTAIIPVRTVTASSFDFPSTDVAGPMNTGHQYSRFAVGNPVPAMQPCPFASPRACPTGGACHLCPARA